MLLLRRTFSWVKGLRGRGGVSVKTVCPVCQAQVEFKIPPDYVKRGEKYGVTCQGEHPENDTFRVSAAVLDGKGNLADRTKVWTEILPSGPSSRL